MAVLQYTKTKAFRIAAVILVLLALYALAGFWLAPKLLRNALLEDIPKTIDAKPSVGEIRVNPFLMQLEIKDFALADSAGAKLLGFQRFFVDFQISSLWHRAYTFSNIDINAPFVNAVISEQGQLNLAKLAPKPGPEKPKKDDAKSGGIPALRIDSFKVSSGSVAFADDSHVTDFNARLEPLNFELNNFTTGVEGGRFTFTAASKLGERIEWHGHLAVEPLESDGEFQIDGLQAHTVWSYLEDKVAFAVNSGVINLNSTYKFSFHDAADLHVDVQKIAVDDLTVRPKDGDADWISLPKFLVSDTNVDLLKKQVRVDAVTLTGLKVSSWLNPDGTVNLMQLAGPPKAPAAEPAASTSQSAPVPAPASATPPAPQSGPAGSPWSVELRQFALRDANITAEDRTVKPVTRLALNPLTVSVEGISLDMQKPLNVELEAKINDSASLNATGQVVPQPVAADLKVKLAGLDLSLAQPYIGQKTSMTLLSGLLNTDLQVHYGSGQPAATVSGDVSVANLHTVDNALHADFINWDRLELQGLKLEHGPDRIDISQVSARKLYARVIIEPDTTLNVTRVLAAPGATLVVPGAPGTTEKPSAVTAQATPPAKPPGTRKRDAKTASASAPPKSTAPALPLSVKRVVIDNSEANFSDLSIQPNFSASIQKLGGNITGLTTNGKAPPAKIDLKGQVDPFAPVTVKGEVNAMSEKLYTDIALNFRNISLATFNPYSGKFAGYSIAKGKLTTDLHYKIDGRKLDAQHHITVDQLEFGEKTESKDAVSLPIKLAVSLLKDRNGVIDLDVPVTGSLDDPQFKLGPIIWKVFVNILEKAVTAPFALLGRLFGGGPDMQFVDFAPGAADLDAAATEKAAAIVKALDARPQLKLEVPIAALKDIDGPSLIDAQIKTEVQTLQAGAKKKVASTPYEQLDAATKADLLGQLYKKAFGNDAKYPDEVTVIKGKAELSAAKSDYLTRELHANLSVSDEDLKTLATQRARNLQEALLKDSKIDPERIFLANNDKVKEESGKVRLELALK